MRYVKIPEDVTLCQPNGDEIPEAKPIKFLEWMQVSVLVDPKLGKKHLDIFTAADVKLKVRRLFKSMPDIRSGDVDYWLELTDPEWELLKACVTDPSGGYNVSVTIQLTSFLRAFMDAVVAEEEPTREEEKDVDVKANPQAVPVAVDTSAEDEAKAS